MSIRVEWDSDDHTVLRYTVVGHWTWDELHAALERARTLADAAPSSVIHSIIDIYTGSLYPQNALSHFRRMPFEAHPKFKNGCVIIVEDNLFVRSLMNILRRLNPHAVRNFYNVRTMKDAYALLERLRQTAALST
jgi:hypothetical protein